MFVHVIKLVTQAEVETQYDGDIDFDICEPAFSHVVLLEEETLPEEYLQKFAADMRADLTIENQENDFDSDLQACIDRLVWKYDVHSDLYLWWRLVDPEDEEGEPYAHLIDAVVSPTVIRKD